MVKALIKSFIDSSDFMDVEQVTDVLNALAVLAEGCSDHPTYRVHQFPADCQHCRYMWDIKQRLYFKDILPFETEPGKRLEREIL
jgi:hypothetical protein